MEMNFIKCGDYYIPDIKLEKPNIRLGKWGRMRREYLRLAHPVIFSDMVLSETLYEHCAEIEAAANSRMNIILAFAVFILPHIAEWLIIRIAAINYGLCEFIKS